MAFNFKNSNARKEISEKMIAPDAATAASDTLALPKKKGTSRTRGDGWVLAQFRIPEELSKRIGHYCYIHDVTKNDFFRMAAMQLIERLENDMD